VIAKPGEAQQALAQDRGRLWFPLKAEVGAACWNYSTNATAPVRGEVAGQCHSGPADQLLRRARRDRVSNSLIVRETDRLRRRRFCHSRHTGLVKIPGELMEGAELFGKRCWPHILR